MHIVYLTLAFLLNALANVSLKIHSIKGFEFNPLLSPLVLINNVYFFIAIIFFAFNVVFYALALSRIPLSIAYPVMVMMTFLVVNSFAYFYFREPITAPQVIGYIMILVGISLVVGFVKVSP